MFLLCLFIDDKSFSTFILILHVLHCNLAFGIQVSGFRGSSYLIFKMFHLVIRRWGVFSIYTGQLGVVEWEDDKNHVQLVMAFYPSGRRTFLCDILDLTPKWTGILNVGRMANLSSLLQISIFKHCSFKNKSDWNKRVLPLLLTERDLCNTDAIQRNAMPCTRTLQTYSE